MSEATQLNLLAHFAVARRRAAIESEQRAKSLARRGDPDTSHEAARRLVESGRLSEQKRAVLSALRREPGVTSAELAQRMGVDRYTTGRRLPDLEKAGLVKKGEKRICRARGTRAVTWTTTAKGERWDAQLRQL